jgi:hypothetical protein
MAELTYELSFKGVASPTLRAAFVDYEVGSGTGTTWVRCSHDELSGVIGRIGELGLDLLDIRLIAGLAGVDPHGGGGSPTDG